MHEVVVGALICEGRVLLALRSQDKRARAALWDLPGGVVEAGEPELDALARELREELAIQIALDSTSQLARVIAGPDDDPVSLSAWLVAKWEGTPANAAPRGARSDRVVRPGGAASPSSYRRAHCAGRRDASRATCSLHRRATMAS